MKIAICNSQNWFNLSEDLSLKHHILMIQDRDGLTIPCLEQFEPDLIFFPHWNWIVDRAIFDRFECIVFHTAPLPYGRGGSPIQNLILRGHKTSPVCALKMSDVVDGGPIYDREEISLAGNLSEILERLNCTINKMIGRLVEHLPTPKEQIGKAVVFRRLGREDNEIGLDATIEEVYNSIRMLDDASYPSAYILLKNVLMEFSDISKSGEGLCCTVRITNRGQAQ